MALWMEGRITLSAARLETERVGCCFRRGEMMGDKVRQVDFTNSGRRRSSGRSLQWCPPRMSIATELPDEIAFKDMEMERRNPRSVVAIILGGGAGTRLFPLTKQRAKPAVPIGGAYRLIDVPMSNCINSGINKVYILTQFNSASLNRHLARTYNLGNGVNFGDGFVEVLAATQTPGEAGQRWFQGTADAVRQFHWLFEDARAKDIEDVLILSGDHLYRMDYMDFVQRHRQSGADITIACLPMDDRYSNLIFSPWILSLRKPLEEFFSRNVRRTFLLLPLTTFYAVKCLDHKRQK